MKYNNGYIDDEIEDFILNNPNEHEDDLSDFDDTGSYIIYILQESCISRTMITSFDRIEFISKIANRKIYWECDADIYMNDQTSLYDDWRLLDSVQFVEEEVLFKEGVLVQGFDEYYNLHTGLVGIISIQEDLCNTKVYYLNRFNTTINDDHSKKINIEDYIDKGYHFLEITKDNFNQIYKASNIIKLDDITYIDLILYYPSDEKSKSELLDNVLIDLYNNENIINIKNYLFNLK